MGAIDNLSQSTEFQDIKRRLKALEVATPSNSSSIGSGGMRVHSGGVITIENGGLYVNGSATVIGTLNADGTINMSGLFIATGTVQLNGPTSVTGDFTVTGPTKLNGQTDIGGNTSVTGDLAVKGPLTVTGATKLDGKTDIGGNTKVTGTMDVEGPMGVTGTMDIKGKSTLQNDLTVQGGGRIKVGANMTLNPAANGGSVEFTNGAGITSNGSGVDVMSNNGTSRLNLGPSSALLEGGSSAFNISSAAAVLGTPLFVLDGRMQARYLRAAPAGAEANLYRDPGTGELMYVA